MEHARLSVTKRVASWGLVYKIGGTEADGEILSVEQAEDIMTRFNFEQSLLAPRAELTLDIGSQATMPSLKASAHAASL